MAFVIMSQNLKVGYHFLLIFIFLRFTHIISEDPVPYNPSVDLHSKSMLGFCDGDFYVPKAKNSCSHGITFGNRPPKCVCIKGAYQMYMDNCEIADGFAEEICTLLHDKAKDVKVKGIKLTREMKWEDLGVVCNRMVGTISEWGYGGESSKIKLNHLTKQFYTINGQAMITTTTTKGKVSQQICVQKESKPEVICIYKHIDNVDNWKIDKFTDLVVKSVCPAGKTPWTPMHSRKCFNPLTLLDSDCQVPCHKTNLMGEGGKFADLDDLDGNANLEGNCTDPKAFFSHENKFIDRQLLMFMVLDQIRKPGDTRTVAMAEPKTDGLKKAYTLYELVKVIALSACSHPYLKKDVLEWASKFFMYLHKANKMQFEIKLSEDDFLWIHSILTQCANNTSPLTLAAQDQNPVCPTGQQKATGYCRPSLDQPQASENKTSEENDNNDVEDGPSQKEHPSSAPSCDYTPVKISQMYANYETKHHVPEYNWLFLDIVHMNCFQYFNQSYRMFHILEQTYEQLFTTPIKDYWHFPRWDFKVKKSMLTVEADVVMWNAQICVQSVYHFHENKIHRLVRPSRSKYPMRKKRNAEALSTTSDILCAKSKSDFKFPDKCSDKKKG